MAQIYVLEDDVNIQEIEMYALTASSFSVRAFSTAAAFREALHERKPDLLVLDLMLPDADGYDIVQEMRSDPSYSKIPILMVTARGSEMDKVRGLDLGADDYLAKPFGIMELISRVKAILRRTSPADSDSGLCRAGSILMDDEKHEVRVDGRPVELTFKEYSLLKLLMDNAGRVQTREEILDKVWNTDFAGESRTLDMHIRSLRKKLGNAGAQIRTLRNVGYILDDVTRPQ
ncbi:MAG: response regulator transcription factor [Lachnospiraceae bacterium]|nr:response regulator transcription factor [Lachnospiraceae bacterium]